MLDEILLSKSPDTIEEEFTLSYCQCGHAMSGKDNEHFAGGSCMALIFHGCWKSCACLEVKPAIFEFIFTPEELVA